MNLSGSDVAFTFTPTQGPVYTKRQSQCSDNVAIMLMILLLLKTMESLQIGFVTHFWTTSLFSVRTVWLASSQSCRSLYADAWCKRAPIEPLTHVYVSSGFKTFVIFVTMVREAIDDIRRFRRDREINGKKYKKLTPGGIVYVSSADIKVGDLIIAEKVSYCLHFFKPYSTQVP